MGFEFSLSSFQLSLALYFELGLKDQIREMGGPFLLCL